MLWRESNRAAPMENTDWVPDGPVDQDSIRAEGFESARV
jgi:hypothetical protein